MANTFSSGNYSKAICDRCRFKFDYRMLMPDGNSPGLRVCLSCRDNYDPWRLPPHQAEAIALRFPRPDVALAIGTENQFNTQLHWDRGLFWDTPGLQWDTTES